MNRKIASFPLECKILSKYQTITILSANVKKNSNDRIITIQFFFHPLLYIYCKRKRRISIFAAQYVFIINIIRSIFHKFSKLLIHRAPIIFIRCLLDKLFRIHDILWININIRIGLSKINERSNVKYFSSFDYEGRE